MSEDLYDIIVVGGGPMGLSAAYQCALKEKKKVLVLEKFEEFGNAFGSSPGFSRQFRTCYSEKNLCELAIKSSGLWNNLMDDLDNHTLLNRTGCLWFGDSTVHNSEGNIDKAVENLTEAGKEEGVYYDLIEGKEAILSDPRFSFVSQAVSCVKNAKALFVRHDGGTINVPALIECFTAALRCSDYSTLLTKACVTSIDYSDPKEIRVLAKVSSGENYTGVEKIQEFHCAKVILTPGAYINDVLSTLKPTFPKRINLTIYLWSSTYFHREKRASCDDTTSQDPSKWPIWYFFGQPKPLTDDGALDSNAYYGFPSEPDRPDFLRVAPAFTSKKKFDFDDYPPSSQHRPIDPDAMKFTSEFVQKSMPSLSSALMDDEQTTCIAGFADIDDESAGFVLDFLPDFEECAVQKMDHRIVVFTGGWGMKYVPAIGKILVDLALRGKTTPEYARLIEDMKIDRGILEDAMEQGIKKKKAELTCEQRAAKFRKMCF